MACKLNRSSHRQDVLKLCNLLTLLYVFPTEWNMTWKQKSICYTSLVLFSVYDQNDLNKR